MIAGFGKHDTRDFIWTMHKAKEDWEPSSKKWNAYVINLEINLIISEKIGYKSNKFYLYIYYEFPVII